MQPLDTPPFYAGGIGAAITGTCGGVKVKTDMQVVATKGVLKTGILGIITLPCTLGQACPPRR